MKLLNLRIFFIVIFVAIIFSSCRPDFSNTTAPSPTLIPTIEPQQPTIIPTSLPEPKDIPIYKTSFEGNLDEVLKGYSGSLADAQINTLNVDVQSGSQSVEITGILKGPIYSRIQLSLDSKTITGEPVLDLSNKTIGFSYFIPEESPIDTIGLACVSEQKAVELFGVSAIDEPLRSLKGNWHYEQFDIRTISETGTWAWSEYSPEESRRIIQNCSTLLISGIRGLEGVDQNAVFYIDNLRWIRNDNLNSIALDKTSSSLRNYADARNIKLSTVLWHTADRFDNFADPWYLYTLANQFNTTTVGVGLPPEEKPADISAIEFDYTLPDEVVKYAEGNGLMLEGGLGFWHTNNPRWITDATYDELKAWIDRKLESDLSHFKGKVQYWGIFNELLDWNGNTISLHNRQKKDPNDIQYGTEWAPYGGRYSPYVDGNDLSLIDYAYTKAKLIDPNAKYYLNEGLNDVEMIGSPAAEYFFQLVKGMKERGVPIDGVGLQVHLAYPSSPPYNTPNKKLDDINTYLDKVDQNVKRFAEAGLFVGITEFECQIRLDDLDLTTEAGKQEYQRRQQSQSQIYAGMMKIVRDNPNLAFFRFWTISDQPFQSAFDWRGSGSEEGRALFPFVYTDSFLFDRNYEPKPAFDAVMEVLKP